VTIANSATGLISLQLKFVATQHTSAFGSERGRPLGHPWSFNMKIWKKIVAAYIAAAGTAGPFMINSFY
jgi:hypothetical protein